MNGTGEEASQNITRSREGHGEEMSEVETLHEKLSAAQEMSLEVGVVITSLRRHRYYIITSLEMGMVVPRMYLLVMYVIIHVYPNLQISIDGCTSARY